MGERDDDQCGECGRHTQWRWELAPLLQGRARLNWTDGKNVGDFW